MKFSSTKNDNLQPVISAKIINSYFKGLIYTLFIVAPVFSNYVFFGKISIGDVFLFVFLFYYLSIAKFSATDFLLIPLAMIVCLISFYCVYQSDFNLGFYRSSFYYIFIFLIGSKLLLDSRLFISIYIRVSFFLAISLILQWFMYSFFSVSLPLQLPISYYQEDTLKAISFYRSGGWFREPSFFMLYITPLLFYLIYKRNFKKYAFFVISGLISTSTLIVPVVFSTMLFYFIITRKFSGFLWVSVLSITSFFLFQDYLINSTLGERTSQALLDGGTLFVRVAGSIELVQNQHGLLPNALSYHYFFTGGYNGNTWFSSIGLLYASFGLLGLILLMIKLLALDVFIAIMISFFIVVTNAFSGVYGFFMVFTFVLIKNILLSEHVHQTTLERINLERR